MSQSRPWHCPAQDPGLRILIPGKINDCDRIYAAAAAEVELRRQAVFPQRSENMLYCFPCLYEIREMICCGLLLDWVSLTQLLKRHNCVGGFGEAGTGCGGCEGSRGRGGY